MASSLSSAGFPLDVATKHAVVFSNNRIKPDMLPDLDKPSLKEMGIVLMGDMIAILRYAKKVSEEMTCERFLVDSVDPSLSLSNKNPDNNLSKINPTKSTVKKLPSKVTNVSKIADSSKTKSQVVAKNNLKVKPNIVVTGLKKKTVGSTRVVAPIKKPEDLQAKKRKLEIETIDSDSDESDEDLDLKMNKRLKSDESKINYKVVMNRPTNVVTKESLNVTQKKLIDQKRTVFDRLGDSSVTSTTNLIDSTTFNITGIGNDVVKRNSGVFKRLGDKDKKDVSAGILKNEINGKLNQPQGILKNKPNNVGTTSIKLVKNPGKSGTMHADHESKKKIVSSSIKQLVRTTKAMKLNSVTSITRKIPNNKLASERPSNLPAKARLGMGMKQVTFNKVATVAHIKKPDVFSRLGV
ncbi:GSCOCG00009035001-RA-CDS [Cotesia congregata]|nr:GSCOCG00009035001-RA-CDS [Cotesia congregata]